MSIMTFPGSHSGEVLGLSTLLVFGGGAACAVPWYHGGRVLLCGREHLGLQVRSPLMTLVVSWPQGRVLLFRGEQLGL